jgi:hypothetical protein
MTLTAVTFGFLCYWIGTLTPENFFVAIGMAAVIAIIGTHLMRPKDQR